MPLASPRLPAAPYSLRRPKITAFLLAACTAGLFILPFILKRGGIFYVAADQITQLHPFSQQIVRSLHAGQFFYDFNLDLGTGLINGYTYYNLASVFNLPLYLFPAAATPYLLGPLLILKFACAGLFAYLYLRLFTQTDQGALLGSLLYAFSGFAIANMIFPFQDVITLFPLLLWALEQAMRGARRGVLAVAAALNILANPAFFQGCVVFLVLYFLTRVLAGGYKLTARCFWRLATESLAGALLSGFITLPFVLSLLGNPRTGHMLRFGMRWLAYSAGVYFEILRGLLFPPEVMGANAVMLLEDASSPEFYLPLFGMVPVFAFMMHRKKHWAKPLLLACLVFALVPVLNSLFNGLNAVYYTRWLYMPLLICALATVLWLEAAAPGLRRACLLWGGLFAAFCGCALLWKYYYGHAAFIAYWPMFVINAALTVAGLVFTCFAGRIWAWRPKILAALVMLFSIAVGGVSLLINQTLAASVHGPLEEYHTQTVQAGQALPLPQGVYRISVPSSNLYFGHGSPESFTTTVAPGVFSLQAAFGRTRSARSYIEYEEPGLWALLGVEYIIVESGTTQVPLPNCTLVYEGQPYNMLRNNDALPLVVGFTNRIDPTGAAALDNTQKSIALLHGIVLSDADIPGLAPIDYSLLPGLTYPEGVALAKSNAAQEVVLGNGQLRAKLTMQQPGAALISLPYEAGWRCTVNGVETPLHMADWGLMAAACPAGENEIVLTYRPAGGGVGLLLSGAGAVLLTAYISVPYIYEKRRGRPVKGRHENL